MDLKKYFHFFIEQLRLNSETTALKEEDEHFITFELGPSTY